jgi:hypothetical protein
MKITKTVTITKQARQYEPVTVTVTVEDESHDSIDRLRVATDLGAFAKMEALKDLNAALKLLTHPGK